MIHVPRKIVGTFSMITMTVDAVHLVYIIATALVAYLVVISTIGIAVALRYLRYRQPRKKGEQHCGLAEWRIFYLFCVDSIRWLVSIVLVLFRALLPSVERINDRIHDLRVWIDNSYWRACQGEGELRNRQAILREIAGDSAILKRRMLDLEQRSRGRRQFTVDVDHANALIESVDTVINFFDDLDTNILKAERLNENFRLVCAGVAQCVPEIGAALALLQPIIIMYIESHKTEKMIPRTAKRISSLTNEVSALITRVQGEGIEFTLTEIEEIDVLICTIQDGLHIIGKVLEERLELRWGRFRNNDTHKQIMKRWLKNTHEMLQDFQRQRMNVVYYRTRSIMELQRRYSPMLAYIVAANLILMIIVLSLLYCVVDVRNQMITYGITRETIIPLSGDWLVNFINWPSTK